MITVIAEHAHDGGSLWEEYTNILFDPAHFLAELTFTLIDIIILSPILFFLWKYIKKWVKGYLHKEHLRIDKEHGIVHEDDFRTY